MNNKISFIMLRLFGATVLAGFAALVIVTLFKLLLGLTLLAGAATLVFRAISPQRKRILQYEQGNLPGYGEWSAFDNGSVSSNLIKPVGGYASQKGTTIVPID